MKGLVQSSFHPPQPKRHDTPFLFAGSWQMVGNGGDDFTDRIVEAINDMMLDMLAVIARKDCTDRRRRQARGIETARKAGKYRDRSEDAEYNTAIAAMLRKGMSWRTIMRATKCSRTTVAKVAKREALAFCIHGFEIEAVTKLRSSMKAAPNRSERPFKVARSTAHALDHFTLCRSMCWKKECPLGAQLPISASVVGRDGIVVGGSSH